jgi:hypothetical protein
MGWDVYPHLSAPQQGHEMARKGNSGIIETRLQMGAVLLGILRMDISFLEHHQFFLIAKLIDPKKNNSEIREIIWIPGFFHLFCL